MRRAGRLLLLLLAPGPLHAQEPRGVEAGGLGVLLAGRRDFVGGGGTIGWRPGGGVRLQLAALGGDRGGGAGRGELVGHLLLEPARVGGLGFYAIGGLAGTFAARARGDLVLGLGIETRPGARVGLALEAGIGGGVRVAVGLRRRWLHRPGRPR
ncbi:MAG: hypothetical protein U0104_09155 [Gemmatimonadales bacterium]